jgi:hypothetical protein
MGRGWLGGNRRAASSSASERQSGRRTAIPANSSCDRASGSVIFIAERHAVY